MVQVDLIEQSSSTFLLSLPELTSDLDEEGEHPVAEPQALGQGPEEALLLPLLRLRHAEAALRVRVLLHAPAARRGSGRGRLHEPLPPAHTPPLPLGRGRLTHHGRVRRDQRCWVTVQHLGRGRGGHVAHDGRELRGLGRIRAPSTLA